MTSAESIRERYAIPDGYAPVLEELAAVAPLDPVLPRAARARVHLARLAVPAAQVDAVVDALPAVRDDAAAWWLVSRAYTQLVRRIGAVGFVRPRWPSLAAADDPLAPYLYVAVFLAALPDITRWYAEHDVDEAVLWPTLSDVGTRMAIRTRVTGRRGLDTEQRW
ncbi:MAG TPA: acyltransferase domain-containing protein, partial [Acidimicrobiia bacterium]|nr:acyltransferase domain-containing protein [Acidimicrobiia bacterium]